jgi:hypothetical protein
VELAALEMARLPRPSRAAMLAEREPAEKFGPALFGLVLVEQAQAQVRPEPEPIAPALPSSSLEAKIVLPQTSCNQPEKQT